MKKLSIKPKIKRNMLDKIAGEYFRDEDSVIVQHLNSANKKALVGIQQDDGMYTILGENYTYYKTNSGTEDKIAHNDFLEILSKNAKMHGKSYNYEFVPVNDINSVWVFNAFTMNALWNTLLLLYDNEKRGLKYF